MIIKEFEAFQGVHCETTATGTLLKQLGIELSEPMLFGLGEGLSYIFWNMKIMDFPFIGGRVKPDALTENICNNLNLKLVASETSSLKKAWQNVKNNLDNNIAVGLKLDCYHLEYFTQKIHFAGHYAAIYGYDDEDAYLVDTGQQGCKAKTSLRSLALARSEKGPMSSRNRSYIIKKNDTAFDIKEAVMTALKNNVKNYLNPPIQNISYKGILKTSKEIKKWFQSSSDIKRDFCTTAMLMERAGTGGAIFRNLYKDFLKESFEILLLVELNTAYHDFVDIAVLWEKVAELFNLAGETEDVTFINQASEILIELSGKEKNAMEKLNNVFN